MISSDQFEEILNRLDPEDDAFILETETLVDQLDPSQKELVCPAIFSFFEKHPLVPCGSPGPLIRLVEAFYPSYLPALKVSAIQNPSYNTMWMINRVLNLNIPQQEKSEYLNILKQLQNDPNVPWELQDHAADFLRRHSDN